MCEKCFTYYNIYKGILRNQISCDRLLVAILCLLVSTYCANVAAKTVVTESWEVSDKAEARIDFRLDLTNVDKSYHSNDTTLVRILETLDSLVLNPRKKVRRLTVVGTASPEGPYDHNVWLAHNRAQAFINILQQRYSFPDSIYTVSTIPEDWEGLRLILEEDSTIPYAADVLDFLACTEPLNLPPATREYRLKHLDGGRPYAAMLKWALPYLRRASVVIYYDTEYLRHKHPLNIPPVPEPILSVSVSTPALPVKLTVMRVEKTPRRRFWAIKTNLLWDAALCANLGFEVELWPHWSLDVPVWYSPYDITERWRIRLLASQPEVRYWLKDAGKGHYFGVHTSIIGYNVSFNGAYRHQDPNWAAFGLGVGYGYAFHLDKAKRWGLEAQIGAGYITYKWIRYENTGHNGPEVSRGKGTYWGITRGGITLSYKFYRERKERRWMKW